MIYFTGTVIMGVLGLANTTLLTRFLSQQVYAMYGLLTTFVTTADMFIALGYDKAYVRFYYNHDRTPLGFLWQCLKVPAIIFGAFALLWLEPGQHLVQYIFGDRLAWLVVLAILGEVLVSSINRFTHSTVRMAEYAGNFVVSNIVAKSGFLVFLLVLSPFVEEITFGFVVLSFVIAIVISLGISLLVFRKLGSSRNPTGQSVTNKELFHYGFPYMLNNVIVLIIPMLEKIIIRDLAGWELLSVFTTASTFQTVVLMLVATLNNIWNPIVYKHCDNEAAFKPVLHTFGTLGILVTTLGMSACILLRRWLVLLLDAKYFTVYTIVPAAVMASCFTILSVIYEVGVNIQKKTKYFVIGPLLQIAASVALCYLLIPKMGLIGIGLAVLISVGINRLFSIVMGLHYYNTGVSEAKTFVLCAACVAAAVISMFWTSLVGDVIVSVALLATMVIVLNKEIAPVVKYALSLVRSTRKK